MTVGAVAGEAQVVDVLSSALEQLRLATSMLSPNEIWTCSDATVETVVMLQAEIASATAALGYLAVRDADVRDLASKDGAASTASWLAKKLTLKPGEAKARVKTAEVLCRQAPATRTALVAGWVNDDQTRAITKGLASIDEFASADEFAEAEQFFLTRGPGLHAGHIKRLAEKLRAVLDPDGKEPKEKARKSRSLTITDLGDGQHRIIGILTAECAALMNAALDPLAAPRPAVKGPNGEPGEKDPRSAAQRRHDALQEMTQQYLRHGDTGTQHGVRPHLHITANIETLKGDTGHPFARTATGEDLDIETLRRIACDAGITPIVANTLGEPLAVGRESRTATPAQWKALVARDIGCIGEGCTRPASWCEAHHIIWWEYGGQTDLDNMALVCTHEHYLVHHEGWTIEMADDGHPVMIPPEWIDPEQRPRRNAHWKLIRDGLKTNPDRGP